MYLNVKCVLQFIKSRDQNNKLNNFSKLDYLFEIN